MDKEIKNDLEHVFNLYYNALYKTSAILLCNEQDAYDAVQETFIKYLQNKKEFRDKEHEKLGL